MGSVKSVSHRVAVALAVAYLIGLAYMVFWPSPVDRPIDGTLEAAIHWLQRHGVPPWLVNYGTVEFSSNILMFVPFGIMAALRLPAKYWWAAVAAAALASGAIELSQALFLPHRTASLMDVLANTTGGALGAVAVAAGRVAFRRSPAARRAGP